MVTFGLSAHAARLRYEAEGPSGHASCSDGLDNDKDGLVDGADAGCSKLPAFSSVTGGWAARAEDGVLWGNAQIFADATSPSGNAVRLIPGSDFGTGGVRLCGTNFNINPGYLQLYQRSPASVAWLRLDTTHGQPMDNNDAMLVAAQGAYGWQFSNRAASIPSRTLAADQLPYNLSGTGLHCWDIALDSSVVLYAAFAANSVSTPPMLPGGGGIPNPEYTVLRVNTLAEGSMDGQCNQSDWADELRRLGFSRQKGRAMIELARVITEGRIDLEGLAALPDEEAVERLRDLRGVGRWTVEYILLRGLGRTHVFPGDDVGARNNLQRWLHLAGPLDYEGVQRTHGQGLVYIGGEFRRLTCTSP